MWWLPLLAIPAGPLTMFCLGLWIDWMERRLARKAKAAPPPVDAIADFRSYKRERYQRDVLAWRGQWLGLTGGQYCSLCKGTHRDGTHGPTIYERGLGAVTKGGSIITGPPRTPPADMIEYRMYY